MRPPRLADAPLCDVLAAARDFGLTQPEIWAAADVTLGGGAGGGSTPSVDALTAELARRILTKERELLAERRRAAVWNGSA